MKMLNLAEMTVEVSVLILLISLIRSLFRKKCNPNIRYLLWTFVALRVLIPFKLELSLEIPENWNLMSFHVLTEQAEPEADKAGGRPAQSFGPAEGQIKTGDDITYFPLFGIPSGDAFAEPQAENFPVRVSVKSVLFLLWLLGVTVMTLYVALNNRRLYRILLASRKRIRKLPGGISLYAMPGYNCLAGILSPAVYVDIGELKDLAVVKHIICHELQHYRVRDNYWQFLRVLCLILQWHNPFMWWAYFASRRDCEIACDARVVKGMSKEERYEYGSSLLAVLEGMIQKKQNIFFQTSMGTNRKFISERIHTIVESKTEKRVFWGILLLTGAACFLAFHIISVDIGRKGAEIEEQAEVVRKKVAAAGERNSAEEESGTGAKTEAGAGTEGEAGREDSIQTTEEVTAPTKEEVLAAREKALEGMSEEEIGRLKENVKVANQRMEQAYLYDNIFAKLEDTESLYWNYFDEKGEIQIGWAYGGSYWDVLEAMEKENISKDEFYARYGTPVMDTNRFDAENFMELFGEMKESVKDEKLREDLQLLMDETALAARTHEVEHVRNIYRLLHDMDYYLLRYGREDVGNYVRDTSLISRYYGVLSVYKQ